MRLVVLLRHMFLHNGAIKLVCVAVAGLLWVILNSSQGGTVEAQPIPTQDRAAVSSEQSVADAFHPSTPLAEEKRLTARVAISPSTTGRVPNGSEVTSLVVSPAFQTSLTSPTLTGPRKNVTHYPRDSEVESMDVHIWWKQ